MDSWAPVLLFRLRYWRLPLWTWASVRRHLSLVHEGLYIIIYFLNQDEADAYKDVSFTCHELRAVQEDGNIRALELPSLDFILTDEKLVFSALNPPQNAK